MRLWSAPEAGCLAASVGGVGWFSVPTHDRSPAESARNWAALGSGPPGLVSPKLSTMSRSHALAAAARLSLKTKLQSRYANT